MPVISQFTVGDTLRFSVTFSVGGTNTDPTVITFRRRDPNGVIQAYVYGTDVELVRTAVGLYRIDLALSVTGEYWYRWEGTGSAAGVSEDRVLILKSLVV